MFDRLTRGANNDGSFQFDMTFGVFTAGGPLYALPSMYSPQLDGFIEALINNYDAVLSGYESLAGIADPLKQLSHQAAYVPVALKDAEHYVAVVKEMHKTAAPPSNGNGALALLGVMQGVTNMAQAQSQANIAAANRDMGGQMQAAMNAGRAETQTLNAISNPNAPAIQPLAPVDQNAIQNATNQQLASIQAKQAQVQAQQAAQQRPQQTASIRTVPSFPVNAPAKPVADSGTAPPPTCVDLGPGNCMPIEQYQQLQAQKLAAQQAAAANSGICPASGFIPGAMRQVANDAALGVQCVPGQPYSVSPTTGTSSNGSGGYSSATVGGGGAGCQDATRLVQVDSNWFQADIADKEVVAFVTNRSNSKITCTIAFDGGGSWVDYETGSYNVGDTHKGGQGGGLWHMGASSSRVKDACYLGSDPADAAGHSCNAGLTFAYP